MTICDVCKKDVRITKSLNKIHFPELCEECLVDIVYKLGVNIYLNIAENKWYKKTQQGKEK